METRTKNFTTSSKSITNYFCLFQTFIHSFMNYVKGSKIGPGTYNLKGSIDELIHKRVGEKGPYQLFTINRSAPIATGHYAVLDTWDLSPDFPSKDFPNSVSFTHELEKNKKQGAFGKFERFPKKPSDRIAIDNPGIIVQEMKQEMIFTIFFIQFKVFNQKMLISQDPVLMIQLVHGNQLIFIRNIFHLILHQQEMINVHLLILVFFTYVNLSLQSYYYPFYV